MEMSSYIFPRYSEYLDIPYLDETSRQFRRIRIMLYKRAIIRKGRTRARAHAVTCVSESTRIRRIERTKAQRGGRGSARVPGDVGVAPPLIILTRSQTARNYGDACFTVSRMLAAS